MNLCNKVINFIREINVTEHQHGKMDISEQKRVFSGFIKFGLYVGLFSIFVLVFLALFNS